MLNTLTVYREWQNSYSQTTILRDSKGFVKAIIPSSIKQPRLNQKDITINCNRFLLNWDIVAREKQVKKDNLKQTV